MGKDEILDPNEHRAPYPFVRDTYTSHDFDGEDYAPTEQPTWKPGIRHEARGWEGEWTEMVCDGIGEIILVEVGRYKPPGFPTRVFFTRRWRDPDGREFGKNKLLICVASKFARLCRGYMHPYTQAALAAPEPR